MKKETLKIPCEHACGAEVNWKVCDDDGENCVKAIAVQCSHCGKLNLGFKDIVTSNPTSK